MYDCAGRLSVQLHSLAECTAVQAGRAYYCAGWLSILLCRLADCTTMWAGLVYYYAGRLGVLLCRLAECSTVRTCLAYYCAGWLSIVFLYRLAEAEERYNQRDSRPEDLELIQQLREEVQEREMRVKQLIVSTACPVDMLPTQSDTVYQWR